MKLSIFIFISASLVLVSSRIIDMEFTNNTVSHPGHCYSNRLGVGAMEKGEAKTLVGQCIRAICEDDTTIYYDGCGKWKLPSYCRTLPGELAKPYPDCCPYVDCS